MKRFTEAVIHPRLLLALPLLLYLAVPTRNYYWDGVAFAISIEKHRPFGELLHANHLLYSPFGALLYAFCQQIGLSQVRALHAMQFANCLLAWVCVVLVHRLLRNYGADQWQCIGGALLFAFSATWWRFATDANAYIPSVLCLLLAAIWLPGRVILGGLATAAGMLFHQLAIFFVPVGLYWLRGSRAAMIRYLAASVVSAGAIYIAVYGLTGRHDFLAWITSHSEDSRFFFDPIWSGGLLLRGTLRLLFGGKLGDFLPGVVSYVAGFGTLAAGAFLAAAFWRAREGYRMRRPPAGVVLWIAVYVVFLFFWMPRNTFYRLFYLPPLIVLLVTSIFHARRALLAFAALIACWNFCFMAYPQSKIEFNAPLHFALSTHSRWPAGTPILYARFHPDLWTISYFNQQAFWYPLETIDLRRLEEHLANAKRDTRTLWIEQTAYELLSSDPAGRRWLQAHPSPEGRIHFNDGRHEYIFHAVR